MLIALKRLKVPTSNLAGVFPGIVPTWPLTNVSKKWAWSRSRDPVNFWALNANSSKTAEDTNFKFGRRVPKDSPDMTHYKYFRYGRGHGHVTTTTVPCKLQQWDRYRVPQNVFLFLQKRKSAWDVVCIVFCHSVHVVWTNGQLLQAEKKIYHYKTYNRPIHTYYLFICNEFRTIVGLRIKGF